MVPRSHPSFQLALLGRLCNLHFSEARQFGGVWRLEYGTFNPPAWATELKAQEVAALEARTHPTDLPTWKFAPTNYTEQDIKKQVEQGLRPDPATVVAGFWAPADKNMHWTRQIQTWTSASPVACVRPQMDSQRALRGLERNALGPHSLSSWSQGQHEDSCGQEPHPQARSRGRCRGSNLSTPEPTAAGWIGGSPRNPAA